MKIIQTIDIMSDVCIFSVRGQQILGTIDYLKPLL